MLSTKLLCLACAILAGVVTEALTGDFYPKYPLTYKQLTQDIFQNQTQSRLYYEIYSLDPSDPSWPLQLPVLRKTVIRWNMTPGGGFTNNYAGWLPPMPTVDSTCVTNDLPLYPIENSHLQFEFNSEFPVPEPHIGTIFTSHPERYHINWYCPESQLVRAQGRYRCVKYLRMSIYSAHGPNNLPWHLIVEDLCKNKVPPMDDPRWYMTYDAPIQCTFANSRRRRDVNI